MRGRRAGGGLGEQSGCDQIEPLLEAYHDGTLSEADAQAVRQHLHGCESCTARLGTVHEVDRLLVDALQPIPPHELRSRLYERIAHAQAGERSSGTLSPALGMRDIQRPAGGAWWRASDAPASTHGPRRISVAAGAVAALTVAALLALVFARLASPGLGTGGASMASRAARLANRAAVSFTGLPRFGDWRAAYLGTDRQVHIVSADGSHALTMAGLSDDALLTAAPAPYANVVTSPDGGEVAYVSGSGVVQQGGGTVPAGPVTVVDLRTGATSRFDISTTACYWSPDGSRLIAQSADSSVQALYLLPAHGGRISTVTPTFSGQATGLHRLIGWTDNTHVLAVFTPSPASGAQGDVPAPRGVQPLAQLTSGGLALVGLGIVDVTSGDVALLDDLPLEPETFLSPDGKLLFIPTSWWNDTAMVVDTTTGQIRQLPVIAQAFAGKLQRVQSSVDAPNANWSMHAAWLPGAYYEVALSLAAGGPSTTGGEVSQPSGVWLLDLTDDRAAQVTSRTYPLAWVPGTSTLLTADPPAAGADGTYPAEGAGVGSTLYALASPEFGGTHEVPIASSMLAYLGLVRTT